MISRVAFFIVLSCAHEILISIFLFLPFLRTEIRPFRKTLKINYYANAQANFSALILGFRAKDSRQFRISCFSELLGKIMSLKI